VLFFGNGFGEDDLFVVKAFEAGRALLFFDNVFEAGEP